MIRRKMKERALLKIAEERVGYFLRNPIFGVWQDSEAALDLCSSQNSCLKKVKKYRGTAFRTQSST